MRKHVPVLFLVLAGACAGPVMVSSPARPAPTGTSPVPRSSEALPAQVIRLTNEYRARNGLPELASSPRLMEAARLHAEQMASFQELAHNISAARYPNLADRLDAVGYAFLAAGENVAWNQPDADDVMNIWLNSSGHRANMLDSRVTEIGVAVAYSSNRAPYWVQVFGRPRQ